MSRPKTLRKVVAPPGFKGFKPYGTQSNKPDAIDLLYEEYEALKLADFEGMKHQEASQLMGISRPTFARIYDCARKKIARALVEVKEIKAVYGHARLDANWLICNHCQARFTLPPDFPHKGCPLCNSEKTEPLLPKEEQEKQRLP